MLTINLGAALCTFSLYMMAAGFITTAFGARQQVFLPLFALFVAAQVIGAAMHKLQRGVRALAVIPVLLGALLCRTLPEYLLLPIPLVIVLVTQLTGKYSRDYHDFKSLFFKLLPVVIALLLIILFFEYMGHLGPYFTLIYIIAGILTLRMLRQDAEVYSSAKFTLVNSLPMLVFAVIMVILGNGKILAASLSGVGWLLRMLGRVILGIFGGFGYLFMLLFRKEELVEELAEAEASASPEATEGVKRVRWRFTIGEAKDSTAMLVAIVAIILIIISIAIAVYIIRHNKTARASARGRSLEKRTRYRSPGGVSASGTAEAEFARTSRGIRATYRKWLKLLKKRRVELHRADTSLDILDKRTPSSVPYEAHRTLRELYVKARYNEGYAATHEEQRMAKEAFEKLADSEFNMLYEKHE